ncbi:MAG: hypothetical protein ACHQF0_08140, partial [Chitinophagales bacterium]
MVRFILLLLLQFIFTGSILAQNDTSSKPVDSLHRVRSDHPSADSLIHKTTGSFTDSVSVKKTDSLQKDSIVKRSLK